MLKGRKQCVELSFVSSVTVSCGYYNSPRPSHVQKATEVYEQHVNPCSANAKGRFADVQTYRRAKHSNVMATMVVMIRAIMTTM